jgi:hypothetical protein
VLGGQGDGAGGHGVSVVGFKLFSLMEGGEGQRGPQLQLLGNLQQRGS